MTKSATRIHQATTHDGNIVSEKQYEGIVLDQDQMLAYRLLQVFENGHICVFAIGLILTFTLPASDMTQPIFVVTGFAAILIVVDLMFSALTTRPSKRLLRRHGWSGKGDYKIIRRPLPQPKEL